MLSRNILINRILPCSILVCVLVAAGFVYLSSQTSKTAEAAWYSSSWTYRKTITIDHTKLSTAATSTFSNYPLLVSVTDSDLASTGNGGKQASSTGLDILFTDSDGVTKLDHEVESYSSTTGQLVAWVRIPTLTSSSDYPIYIYFGNANAADQSNKTGVWDSNYQGVWHLSNGTVLNLNDSTSNGFNGVNHGATATTTGKIYGGMSVNGSTYASVGNVDNTPTTLTVSAWINPSALSAHDNYIASNRTNGNAGWGVSFYYDQASPTNSIDFTIQSVSDYDVAATFTNNQWYYVTYVYSGASSTVTFYQNGSSLGSVGGLGSMTTGSTTVIGAAGPTGVGGYNFDGTIDEVRVSNIARSADWIKTEYNNQNSPSAFYSIGAATSQATPATPKTGNFVQVGGKFRQVGGKIEIK